MPYKIAENDNEYQVVNTDTGQVHGTHASRAKALAQMRALYAAEGKSADLLDALKGGQGSGNWGHAGRPGAVGGSGGGGGHAAIGITEGMSKDEKLNALSDYAEYRAGGGVVDKGPIPDENGYIGTGKDITEKITTGEWQTKENAKAGAPLGLKLELIGYHNKEDFEVVGHVQKKDKQGKITYVAKLKTNNGSFTPDTSALAERIRPKKYWIAGREQEYSSSYHVYATLPGKKSAGEEIYFLEQSPADLLDAAKSGARNSAADIERLRSIQQIVTELLGETINEVEADDSPAEQLAEHLAELGGKSLNLAYAKSISMAPADVLAVKSIGADEIRGYVTLWGGPNITDIEREYFTPKTDFWDGTLGKSARPLTFDHAQDASFKANPVIGQMIDFGDDEIGRWYIAKLDRSHKYRKAIDRLISEGKLGTSSDSAPQYVERVKTGKSTWLKTWPLFAAALTDTPAEPRMIGSIEYYKSIGISLPDRVAVPWQFMTSITRRLKINP